MSHYYSKEQDSPLNLQKIDISVRGIDFQLYSGSGVFSKKRLDVGTKVLIEHCIPGKNILDLGCGIGTIGIALKLLHPETTVTMSDINTRAVKLARMNLNLNKIKAQVIESDIFTNITDSFDTILLNPPQTAGRDICIQMIEESKTHLQKGGTFQMVARHKKGGKTLSEHMENVYGNCEVLGIKSGYRVYSSLNS